MADYDSSLPVRTEADPDERLQSKIVDFTDPSLGMEVDSDKNAHVEIHGNDSGDVDRVIRTSENGNIALDGFYDGTTNTNPSTSGVVAHTRGATIDETSQGQRVTATPGESDKIALDVAISHSNGDDITEDDPLFVAFAQSPGEEVHPFKSAPAIAANASDTHTYAVTGFDLELWQVEASASGKAKMEVKVGPSGTEVTKFVQFNSTANNNMSIKLEKPITVPVGENVLVIMTNRDNQAQDLYSTIVGLKKTV